MTNEETKVVLKSLADNPLLSAEHITKALYKAIELVESQPCEDCRNCKRWDECPCGKEGHTNGTSIGYSIGECKDYEPSVTPQPTRWIPVSERMPEKTDYYLIQYSREVCPDEMAVAFYSVEEAEVDSNYTWEFKPIADCKEVIAWMPLPQPYKAESEDKE